MAATVIRPATPADAGAIAQVRVDSWRTTYRGMIPAAYLAAMKVEDSASLWTRILEAASGATSVYVAVDGGTVVGFAAGNVLAEPKHGLDAELSAVYLVEGAQRTGTGRRLVAAVAAALHAHGAHGMIVWVIAGNKGARAFYEQLGAELLVEQPFSWDGMDLVEAGYGWRDLSSLLAAAGRPATLH